MVSLEKPDCCNLIAPAEAPRLRPAVVEDRLRGQDEKRNVQSEQRFFKPLQYQRNFNADSLV